MAARRLYSAVTRTVLPAANVCWHERSNYPVCSSFRGKNGNTDQETAKEYAAVQFREGFPGQRKQEQSMSSFQSEVELLAAPLLSGTKTQPFRMSGLG